MRWELFTWILAGGVFSMLWFLYLSIAQDHKHRTALAQYFRRHRTHRHRDGSIANA
jgi:hypothetical protein